jgi:hypothetical protein
LWTCALLGFRLETLPAPVLGRIDLVWRWFRFVVLPSWTLSTSGSIVCATTSAIESLGLLSRS